MKAGLKILELQYQLLRPKINIYSDVRDVSLTNQRTRILLEIIKIISSVAFRLVICISHPFITSYAHSKVAFLMTQQIYIFELGSAQSTQF